MDILLFIIWLILLGVILFYVSKYAKKRKQIKLEAEAKRKKHSDLIKKTNQKLKGKRKASRKFKFNGKRK